MKKRKWVASLMKFRSGPELQDGKFPSSFVSPFDVDELKNLFTPFLS